MTTPNETPAASSPLTSMPGWSFCLFVFGEDVPSQEIQRRLERVCERHLHDDYELQVIDITVNPDQADAADIIAVPTVIRARPVPERRVIGDLSNESQTIAGLGIPAE